MIRKLKSTYTMNSLKIKSFILIIIVGCTVSTMAQTSEESGFQKQYGITAQVGGGFCRYPIFQEGVTPGFGLGVGMSYDFHHLWRVLAGIRYEGFFGNQNGIGMNSLQFPCEMEFHVHHFYVRGGALFGIALNTPTAANAKEILHVGGTIGLGGYIPITSNDQIEIGLHGAIIEGFEHVYHDNSYNWSHEIPRYNIMLNVGYTHRF